MVWIDKEGSWKMQDSDPDVTSHEYEEFLYSLEGILFGYLFAKGLPCDLIYARGDFAEERTEMLCATNDLTEPQIKEIIAMMQNWLRVPRWETWRIIFQPSGDRALVIYSNAVVDKAT